MEIISNIKNIIQQNKTFIIGSIVIVFVFYLLYGIKGFIVSASMVFIISLILYFFKKNTTCGEASIIQTELCNNSISVLPIHQPHKLPEKFSSENFLEYIHTFLGSSDEQVIRKYTGDMRDQLLIKGNICEGDLCTDDECCIPKPKPCSKNPCKGPLSTNECWNTKPFTCEGSICEVTELIDLTFSKLKERANILGFTDEIIQSRIKDGIGTCKDKNGTDIEFRLQGDAERTPLGKLISNTKYECENISSENDGPGVWTQTPNTTLSGTYRNGYSIEQHAIIELLQLLLKVPDGSLGDDNEKIQWNNNGNGLEPSLPTGGPTQCMVNDDNQCSPIHGSGICTTKPCNITTKGDTGASKFKCDMSGGIVNQIKSCEAKHTNNRELCEVNLTGDENVDRINCQTSNLPSSSSSGTTPIEHTCIYTPQRDYDNNCTGVDGDVIHNEDVFGLEEGYMCDCTPPYVSYDKCISKELSNILKKDPLIRTNDEQNTIESTFNDESYNSPDGLFSSDICSLKDSCTSTDKSGNIIPNDSDNCSLTSGTVNLHGSCKSNTWDYNKQRANETVSVTIRGKSYNKDELNLLSYAELLEGVRIEGIDEGSISTANWSGSQEKVKEALINLLIVKEAKRHEKYTCTYVPKGTDYSMTQKINERYGWWSGTCNNKENCNYIQRSKLDCMVDSTPKFQKDDTQLRDKEDDINEDTIGHAEEVEDQIDHCNLDETQCRGNDDCIFINGECIPIEAFNQDEHANLTSNQYLSYIIPNITQPGDSICASHSTDLYFTTDEMSNQTCCPGNEGASHIDLSECQQLMMQCIQDPDCRYVYLDAPITSSPSNNMGEEEIHAVVTGEASTSLYEECKQNELCKQIMDCVDKQYFNQDLPNARTNCIGIETPDLQNEGQHNCLKTMGDLRKESEIYYNKFVYQCGSDLGLNANCNGGTSTIDMNNRRWAIQNFAKGNPLTLNWKNGHQACNNIGEVCMNNITFESCDFTPGNKSTCTSNEGCVYFPPISKYPNGKRFEKQICDASDSCCQWDTDEEKCISSKAFSSPTCNPLNDDGCESCGPCLY